MSEEAKKPEEVKEETSQAESVEKAPETLTETAVAEEASDKATAPKVSEKMEGIIKTIEEMSVLELSDLVKVLEDKFGVSASAPVAAVAAGAAAPGAAAAEEEKSIFTVVLTDVGAKKINVIKEVRALTDLGLKEAKDLVESAPAEIKADLPKDEAEKMKKQLEAAGAKIELK